MLNFIATGISAYLLADLLPGPQRRAAVRDEAAPVVGLAAHAEPAARGFGYHLPKDTVLEGFLVDRHRSPASSSTSSCTAAGSASTCERRGPTLKSACAERRQSEGDDHEDDHPVSGALAGLAGMGPLLSDFHLYGDTFPTALGFTGIAVALLGRNHPGGIAVAAIVWAGIEQAAHGLPTVGVPQEIGKILQGTLLLSAVIAFEVVRRYGQAATVRRRRPKADDRRTARHPAGGGVDDRRHRAQSRPTSAAAAAASDDQACVPSTILFAARRAGRCSRSSGSSRARTSSLAGDTFIAAVGAMSPIVFAGARRPLLPSGSAWSTSASRA